MQDEPGKTAVFRASQMVCWMEEIEKEILTVRCNDRPQ
jgi:hypothetical protein